MMCVSICQPSHRTRIYRILPKGITFQVVFLLYLGHPLFVLAFFDFGGGGLDVIVTVAGQMFVRSANIFVPVPVRHHAKLCKLLLGVIYLLSRINLFKC